MDGSRPASELFMANMDGFASAGARTIHFDVHEAQSLVARAENL